MNAKSLFGDNVIKNPARWSREMSSIDAKWHENRLPYANGTLWQIGRILWKHLADFLKTTRTKFAVICVKKRQKVRFLSPRSSKIIVTKEKERTKGKSEEKKRRRRKKKAMVALLVFIIATLKIVFGRKNCWTQKVYLAIMLSNIRIDDPTKWAALIPNGLKPNSSIFAQIFELKYNKICAGWKNHCPLLETFCDAFIYFFCLFFLYERQQCSDPFHHFIFYFRLRFRFRFQILDRPWANNLTEHGFGVKYDDMKLRYFRKRNGLQRLEAASSQNR